VGHGKSIVLAFNRAAGKIHKYGENGDALYGIMQPGKEFLLSKKTEGQMKMLYFEPGMRFSSKCLFADEMLCSLDGDVKIVDPYCGEKSLTLVRMISAKSVKFLTSEKKLREKEGKIFLGLLQDFKADYPTVEIGSYAGSDLHDRYILSDSHLVMLGSSIKDLGRSESIAIKLHKDISTDIWNSLKERFELRWKTSTVL